MGDFYDQSYNNPYHYNRHTLGDQYKLNMQHNSNNQSWFPTSQSMYPRSTGSILRDNAVRTLLPPRDYLPNQNSNYNLRPNYNPKTSNYNNHSFEGVSNGNGQVTNNFNNDRLNTLKYNLSPMNGREVRKNAESEYRSEYVPYSPEYYQPIRSKGRSKGKRLDVGKDNYIFRNGEKKDDNPIYSYNGSQYRIPSALKKKLAMLENDLNLEEDFDFPDISDTAIIEEVKPTPMKKKKKEKKKEEKKEEEKKEEEKKEEVFVQPYIEDVEYDGDKEIERDDEDEKFNELEQIVLGEKPEISEKPIEILKNKNSSKPNQNEKPRVIDGNVSGKNNKINNLSEDKEKENIIEPEKGEKMKKPEKKQEPEKPKQNIISKGEDDEKPKDIENDNEGNNQNEKPQIMEKPTELISSKTIIKPNESEKLIIQDNIYQNSQNKIPEDDSKNIINEPVKEQKTIQSQPQPQPQPVILPQPIIDDGPKEINKQDSDDKGNDIPIESIDNQISIMEKPEEIYQYKSMVKPSEIEKPQENTLNNQQLPQPILIEQPKQIIIEPNKDDKPIIQVFKEDIPEINEAPKNIQRKVNPNLQKPEIQDPQPKKFQPISVDYVDDDNDYIKHQIISSKEYAVDKIIPPSKEEIEEETPDETISGIIYGVKPEDVSVAYDGGFSSGRPIDDGGIVPQKEQSFKEENVNYDDGHGKGDFIDEGGVVPSQEKDFKEENVNYDDGKGKGDVVDMGGPSQKKKKKFDEQIVDYDDGKNKGDNNEIPGPVEKDEDKKDQESIDYYDNEIGKGRKHQILTFVINKNPEEEVGESVDESYSGIIEGIKPEEGEEIVPVDNSPEDNYEDKEDKLNIHYIKTFAYSKNIKQPEEQEFNYDDGGFKGDDNQQPGIVKQKEKSFEEQVIGYDDGQFKGDDNQEAGAVKQKKKNFKEEEVGYDDGQFKGDDNQEAGAAQRKEFKEEEANYEEEEGQSNEPDFIISGIIPGTGENKEETEYLDEEEFKRKHFVKTFAYPSKKESKFKEEEFGYDDGKFKGDDDQGPGVVKQKEKKFVEEEYGYDAGTFKGDNDQGPGTVKQKKQKFVEQEYGYDDGNFKGDNDQGPGAVKQKENEFVEQEIGYEDVKNVQPEYKKEKYKKKKKNDFKEEEIGYEDVKNIQPKYENEENKKEQFKEEEYNYDDGQVKQPEFEPEKIDENQPDFIISGLIQGIGKEEEEVPEEEEVEEEEKDFYYLDKNENLNKHNVHTNLYGDNIEGIIPGISNKPTGHNYAGIKKESGKVSLSQIYVDYSEDFEEHGYFENL